MSEPLKPNQALFLWRLLAAETAEEREPPRGKAKPDLKDDLNRLVEERYIEIEAREAGEHLVPTDKAWAWAERTSDVQLLKSSSATSAEALEGLLHRLIPFLEAHQIPLATLLGPVKAASAKPVTARKPKAPPKTPKPKAPPKTPKPKAPPKTPKPKAPPKTPKPRAPARAPRLKPQADRAENPLPLSILIEQACLKITGGRRKERVLLASLRENLSSVPREQLDQALRQQQREGKLVLYREDNSAALTQADHDAALIVGDSPRHIVYLEN
jgi:hypothetical protein